MNFKDQIDIKRLPKHVAIIMDGNGRWAEQRGMSRIEGHRAGIEAVRTAIQCLNKHQIKHVTLYSFSTENWKRPKGEIDGLFQLVEERVEEETAELNEEERDEANPVAPRAAQFAVPLYHPGR